MKIASCNIEDLYKTGVYKITNVKSNKIYIGSTTQYFYKRWSQHLAELLKGKHKNEELQKDYTDLKNEEFFEFEILEVIPKYEYLKIIEKEEDLIKQYINQNCYNINPYSAKPYCLGKSLEKRKESSAKNEIFVKEYYEKVKNGDLLLSEVPKKYFIKVNHYCTRKIWNKGLTKENYDYSFLKVPKTKTDLYHQGRISFQEKMRSKKDPIKVYDYKGTYLCTFRSISDIVDYSKQSFHKLPLLLTGIEKRKSRKQQEGIDVFRLGASNIERVCKKKSKHHKGLIFQHEKDCEKILPLNPTDIRFNRHDFKYFYFNGELLLSEEILIEKRNNIGEIFQDFQDNTEIIYISPSQKESVNIVEHRD